MPKRFTDTAIWRRPWFRELSAAQKAAWFYILSECDNVGVWVPDFKAAEFFIGTPVDWDGLIERCNGNIEILDNGKWWLKDFCKFQHGDLLSRKDSPVVRSYLSLLREHGLEHTVSEQYGNSCQTVKGKGKGIGKGTGKGKGTGIAPRDDSVDPLYHAVEKAFLSRNDDKFSNYAKEGACINTILKKARDRHPEDPAALLRSMLDAFWKLKTGDTSAKGFWRGQPFLPSSLSALWDRVLETLRSDQVDPAVMAVINGGEK